MLLGLPLVDQVLLADAVAVLGVFGGGSVIAKGAQQDGQRGQALLSVDDEEFLHTGGAVRGAGGEDQRADEVGGLGRVASILGEFEGSSQRRRSCAVLQE